ncbi:AAA family ATPase [Sphingomonas corticis]|jgi:exonuclease SbcC|uniref:SMC family ATPase n=1 Tax=Sphingomonas corticis TaxID=2722791 RepID=A0ABX1CHN2_9SPHN|nr:SMC family ATPase [Sphingomonas corticis]NJR77502.1 SMC family ATPase [Sphingomonas corticis]
MRPVVLTMTAFGPYAGTEVVDFREATDAGLFGIYGATGSGKSSIFNAMTFALFGVGAKPEQSIATMRSGHADADRLTEVSLLFELGDKRYFVRRQPDQSRPKMRGEGETASAHKAWLFDATAIAVDDVTADNCGVVLAETKVGEVLKLVKELLGYGVEQFRQIVLLPQGRFERFLIADSNQRVEILRELFDVSIYRRIAVRMKEDAAAAKRDFDDGHRLVAQRLADAGFASTDDLAAGITAAAETAQARHDEATAAEGVARTAEQAHLTAEAVEGRFKATEAADRHKLELELQREEIEGVQVILTRAEKAQRAVDLAARLTDLESARVKAIKAEEDARTTAGDAEKRHAISEEAVTLARSRAEQIDVLSASAAEVERRKGLLEGAADLKERWSARQDGLDEAQKAFDLVEGERVRLDALHIRLGKEVESARSATLKQAELNAQLVTATADHGAAKAYGVADRRVVAARNGVEEAKKTRAAAAGEVEPLRAAAMAAERAFIDAQAQVLAGMHLIDGEPCPVCGSAEHPSPAHGEGDPRALETEMRATRERLDVAVRTADLAEAAVRTAEVTLEERVAELAALTKPKSSAADAASVVARVQGELDALGEIAAPAELEQQAARTKDLLTTAAAEAEKARDVLQKARTEEAVAARSYEDAIASVPEALRAEGALEREAANIASSIKTLRDALTEAEERLRKAATDRDTTAAKVLGATDAVAHAEIEMEKGRSAFEARLAEVGLDVAAYELGCVDIPQIAAHAERIRTYRNDVAIAEAQATAANDAIKDVERPDLAALVVARNGAQAECLRTRRAAADADAAKKVLDDLLSSLRDQLERLARLEEETGPLRGLADAFAGDNLMRTPLETFAIGAMFDHVLDAANLRLDPMTGGRYRFERDLQAIGGRIKRGLDIRVHDIQTGRPREISTLSGGETFIAALSLALGLSDIVEMSHGRIRLDTIFIDEGFGSLDTENDSGTLDLVLQVLQEIVGRNRAVGLISHVPLVQQAVPNGFSIVKGMGGSRVERRAA